MTDGYLSRDREYLAGLQRARRKSMTRVDYMPGREALAVIEAKRRKERPGSSAATNSAVIDAIVTEWADLTGINYSAIEKPMSLAKRKDPERSARARMTLAHSVPDKSTQRVLCGAKRHRDGQPCQAKSEPGKQRCRFHGGRSTGPKTEEGKRRVTLNLPRRGAPDGH